MEILTVGQTLEKLLNSGVKYIDCDSYNHIENSKYAEEYGFLTSRLIEDGVFKHFCKNYDDDIDFGYFEYENGEWKAVFYRPYIKSTVKNILESNYSELKELGNW